MIVRLLFFALVAYGLYYFGKRLMTPPPAMRRTDAARLLGLAADADADAVIDAHRRLIARVHPDTGGTAELAAQLNRARDVMLNR